MIGWDEHTRTSPNLRWQCHASSSSAARHAACCCCRRVWWWCCGVVVLLGPWTFLFLFSVAASVGGWGKGGLSVSTGLAAPGRRKEGGHDKEDRELLQQNGFGGGGGGEDMWCGWSASKGLLFLVITWLTRGANVRPSADGPHHPSS